MFNTIRYPQLTLLFLALLLSRCAKEEGSVPPITLLGGTINSAVLTDGIAGVEPEVTISLTFSARLEPVSFERSIRLQASGGEAVPLLTRYAAGGNRAELTANLKAATTYQLFLSAGELGARGERLETGRSWEITTLGDELVTEQPPCVSATAACRESIPLGSSASIEVYGSFPLLAANRRWEKITNAIIVAHGQNRDADAYFQYLTDALRQTDLSASTLLLAPRFAAQGSGSDLFWSDRGWRIGAHSDDGSATSSFTVVDELINRLGDRELFPALERVVITGHSSGGTFTQLYAVASEEEANFPDLSFRYIVANSQYFYYPEDVRWDPGTQSFQPVAAGVCPDYRHWPYGFSRVPDYLSGKDPEAVNDRFAGRAVTYLLGTEDVQTEGSLNTRDCAAVLLGAHRFARGQLIHRLIETYFPETEEHDRLDVPGLGHNAREMYASGEFLQLLSEIFN